MREPSERQEDGEELAVIMPLGDVEVAAMQPERAPRYKPPRHPDSVRQWLAASTVVLFALLLAAGVVAAFVGGRAWTNVESLLNTWLPTVVAMATAAFAFYYSGRT